MQQIPSSEANNPPGNQEITRNLHNPKGHCPVTKDRHLSCPDRNISSPVTSTVAFLQVSPPKPSMHVCSLHACGMPEPITVVNMMILTTFGEEYKLLSSSLCSFPNYPIAPS
jgi:hypothetical protein